MAMSSTQPPFKKQHFKNNLDSNTTLAGCLVLFQTFKLVKSTFKLVKSTQDPFLPEQVINRMLNYLISQSNGDLSSESLLTKMLSCCQQPFFTGCAEWTAPPED